MTEEEKLLISRVNDVFRLCEKYACPRFTSFLDGAMQLCVKENIYCGDNTMFFGGFEDSERKILGVFPEWTEPSEQEFPIGVLKISHTYGGELSHRDYLGSIMSLGIERSKTGDILVDGNTAFVFAESDICSYIKNNIKKIGSRGVDIEICAADDIVLPERKFQTLNIVAASMRLDAIVGALAKLSRAQAVRLIEGGKVSVNHKEILKAAYEVNEGDLISVRGFGRALADKVGANTRSGRLHVVMKKYV